MDLSSLGPGQDIGEEGLLLSQEAADAYQAAVGGDNLLYRQHHVVPPMVVAALAMGAIMRTVQLPAGAVHTGQELEFFQPVAPNTPLRCAMSIGQNSVRRGARFLTLDFQVVTDGRVVVHGLSSVVIPAEATA